jgi:hypothetical protein
MSTAMEQMERKPQAISTDRVHKLLEWIDEELIPHLEDRQDADFEGGSYTPNDEMRLLSDLESILGRSGRPW